MFAFAEGPANVIMLKFITALRLSVILLPLCIKSGLLSLTHSWLMVHIASPFLQIFPECALRHCEQPSVCTLRTHGKEIPYLWNTFVADLGRQETMVLMDKAGKRPEVDWKSCSLQGPVMEIFSLPFRDFFCTLHPKEVQFTIKWIFDTSFEVTSPF